VEWRKSLGSEPATLLITGDKEAGRFMGAFGQFAVDGTNIGNISRAPVQLGNLQNIGIKPENTQDLENAASKEGTLMVFAVADTHHPDRVMKLTDALASLVLRVERSYKMPPTPMPLPPNVVWLHFGKGVRWSSEYWEEQAARKQPSQ
jgi:hypothetical protein